eukprot:7386061-Pyramimonas_sp.AAC.1
MCELVVYSAILEVTDSYLLYPLLGDAIEDKAADKSKLDKLLDTDSVIASFSRGMLDFLDTWNTGGPSRRPWFLLDVLGAPLTDEKFSRWSRGQILKTNS